MRSTIDKADFFEMTDIKALKKKEAFLAIQTFQEYEKRKGEFEDLRIDPELAKHAQELWMQKYGRLTKRYKEMPPDMEAFEYKKLIGPDEAMSIAHEKNPSYPTHHLYDLEDSWLVTYDSGNPPIPGICSCLVNKFDGSTDRFFPPTYKGIRPSEENRIF